jgi:LPXTG-motif cell wall-anchored protein
VLPAHLFLAATYGSGTYGNNAYSAAPLVQIGRFTLPNTGAGWTVLISSLVLALAAGWAMWLWQRARRRGN